jgi:hypothetical protein
MNRLRTPLFVLLLGLIAFACGRGGEEDAASSLLLTVGSGAIKLAVGEQAELSVTPTDGNGVPFVGVYTLRWSSSAPAVASVTTAGHLVGVADGAATITATATRADTGASATASVAVTVGAGVVDAGTGSDAGVTSGLIAAYGFGEGSGTSVLDASGNGRTGTFVGSPTWTTGIHGGALAFGGNGAYVSFGNVGAVNGLTRTTLSAWIKTTQTAEQHILDASRCDGVNGGGPFELGTSFFTAGRATLLVYKSGGAPDYVYVESATSVTDGAWHHIAATYDGAKLSMYVDGALSGSTIASGYTLTTTTNPLELGGNCTGHPYPWNGSVDDLRLYGRALSATEIQTDMNASVGSGSAPSGDAGVTDSGVTDSGMLDAGGKLLYATSFPGTENPISEGGRWLGGLTDGVVFKDVRTTPGRAFASGINYDYDDSLAILKSPVIPNDQFVEVTIYLKQGYVPPSSHEIELLLRGNIDKTKGPAYAPLYEVLIPWGGTNGSIFYQNGVKGGFEQLPIGGPGYAPLKTGDVVRAEMVGSQITVKVNGAVAMTASDTRLPIGKPGIGFFVRPGGTPENWCISSARFGAAP